MIELEEFLVNLSDLIWGNWLIAVLIGTGLYLGVITKFLHIRKLPYILNETIIKPLFKKEDVKGTGNITSFQALCTALGSCIGNGNIVGVATAIVMGGSGAVIWMWIAAIIGMATKYSEILLGVEYREKLKDDTYIGGPMHYIAKGLKLPWLAILYAVLLLLQNAGATLIQANAISTNLYDMFHIGPVSTAILLVLLVGMIIIGGVKRIGGIAQKVVPFMSVFYIVGGLIVIGFNISKIPGVMVVMVKSAFSVEAGIGGVMGYSIRQAMRYGVARGLYSNEAGEGTAAVIHASATVDHPVRQALFGVTEVFVDTILISSITAFVLLTSGVLEIGESPAVLVSMAFGSVHPTLKYIVGLSTVVFGFLSMISQWYLGNTALEYIKGNKKTTYYKYIFLVLILIGCKTQLSLVWTLQDCILGILILPNIVAIILLRSKIKERTNEFFEKIDERK